MKKYIITNKEKEQGDSFMDVIKVIIIVKNQIILNNLLGSLKNIQSIEVIGITESIEEGITYLNKKQVDIVIVEHFLLENRVLDQCFSCINKTIRVKRIIISPIEKKELYYNAFKIGITNVIRMDEISSIGEMINNAYLDNYSPIFLENIRNEFIRLQKLEEQYEIERVKSILTSREIEILRLIDQGLTQTEIADELYISIYTVKNHVSSILKKMEVNSSKESLEKAKQMGII